MTSLPRDLAHDWPQLTALVDAYGARQAIPCRIGVVPPEAWTSDLAADQARAAEACRTCPALLACRRYGIEHPKEVGVYGGLTHDQRRSAARQAKEGAA